MRLFEKFKKKFESIAIAVRFWKKHTEKKLQKVMVLPLTTILVNDGQRIGQPLDISRLSWEMILKPCWTAIGHRRWSTVGQNGKKLGKLGKVSFFPNQLNLSNKAMKQ